MAGEDQTNPKKFRYTLDIRGVQEEVLFNSPDGWLETSIKHTRSKKYGGILRSLTSPLHFVYKGASLLRAEFYTYGLLARVNLLIEKLVSRTWQYGKLYLGKIDFSQWDDDQVSSVTVNCIERDFSEQLDAFEEVEYAISVDIAEAIDIQLPALALAESADFIIAPSSDHRSDAFFILDLTTNQQMSINPSVKGVGFLAQNNPSFDKNNGYNFFVAQTDTIVRVQGNIGGEYNGISQTSINVFSSAGDRKIIGTYTNPTINQVYEFQVHYDFTFKLNSDDRLFFYMKNELSNNTNVGIGIRAGTMSLSYYTITPPTMCKGLRGSYVFDYLVKQMNGRSNPAITTQSKLLAGPLKNIVFTCSNSIMASQIDTLYQAGDNLQIGATYLVLGGQVHYFLPNGVAHTFDPYDPENPGSAANSTFKALVGKPNFTTDADQDGFVRQTSVAPQLILSFKNFFQTIYAIQGGFAGAGMDNGSFCLETFDYFWRRGVKSLDIGDKIELNTFKITPNTDYSFNTIKAGYKDQQYDAINGTQEVNSEQNYSTDLTSPVNELDLVSPVRADPYGIEALRIMPGATNKATGPGNPYANSAASKSDNDVFMIWLKDAPEIGQTYYRPLTVAEGTKSYSGISGTYYNWLLSPKQNILRGGRFLKSVLDKMEGHTITFQSGLKNSTMVTVDLDGRRVAEGDDIAISDLGQPIFLPYNVEFKPSLDFNALDLLDSGPYGEIWLKYRNVLIKGFLTETSVDAGQNTTQQFKLLMTPDIKTEQFIF